LIQELIKVIIISKSNW